MANQDLIRKMETETRMRLDILLINERYYARKAAIDKKFDGILGNIQNEIREANDYIKFLEEIYKETKVVKII